MDIKEAMEFTKLLRQLTPEQIEVVYYLVMGMTAVAKTKS